MSKWMQKKVMHQTKRYMNNIFPLGVLDKRGVIMEHVYKRDEYFNKHSDWKEKQSDQIRFHHYEEAFDHIHNNGFLIFSGKFQSFEFYFLFIWD